MSNKVVAVLGATGNGKSTLCNRLLGSQDFTQGREIIKPESRAGNFKIGQYSMPVVIIDTPGFADDSDSKTTMDKFRFHKFVNVFLIAFNYENPLMNSNAKRAIKFLCSLSPVCNTLFFYFFKF